MKKFRFDPSTPASAVAKKVAHAMSKASGVDGTVFKADKTGAILGYDSLYYVRMQFRSELSELMDQAPTVDAIQKQIDSLNVPWGMIDGNDIRVRFEVYAKVPDNVQSAAGMSWSDLEVDGTEGPYRRVRIGSWRIRDLSKLLASFEAWCIKSLDGSPLGCIAYAMRVYVGVLRPLKR